MSRSALVLLQGHSQLWMPRSLRNVQVGMNLNANEELHRQHYGFYTFGLFTSRRRALACIQARGMTTGALSILPASINEPLRPCLGSDVLTAHETRQMVSRSPARTPLGNSKPTPLLTRHIVCTRASVHPLAAELLQYASAAHSVQRLRCA